MMNNCVAFATGRFNVERRMLTIGTRTMQVVTMRQTPFHRNPPSTRNDAGAPTRSIEPATHAC
jgi:hypothetical protein